MLTTSPARWDWASNILSDQWLDAGTTFSRTRLLGRPKVLLQILWGAVPWRVDAVHPISLDRTRGSAGGAIGDNRKHVAVFCVNCRFSSCEGCLDQTHPPELQQFTNRPNNMASLLPLG